MGLLDSTIKNSIRRGIGQGLSQAISGAVSQAVKPAADRFADETLAPMADRAAENLNQAADNLRQDVSEAGAAVSEASGEVRSQTASMGGIGGLFAELKNAAVDLANEAAKNMKVCEACGEPCASDKEFCPHCGANR